ncbi:MAG: hypothetical protein WD991_02610 [Candidatus Paceibacterota bacterium]
MSKNIKNILIFVAIGGALFALYFFFIKGDDTSVPPLVSTPGSVVSPTGLTAPLGAPQAGGDFLSLLLSVKSIKLNDSIFSDVAFQKLTDSSISLFQDGKEGRPNPFAPLYSEEALVGEDIGLDAEDQDTNNSSESADPSSAE